MQRSFEVGSEPVLSLTRVSAQVTTQSGPVNAITVEVEGSQRYIDGLTIEQVGNTVMITEPEGFGDHGTTVISNGGGTTVISGGRGGVSVIGGTIRGSIITSGSGKVIIDGVDVTKLAREAGGEPEPEPVIVVNVPDGTNVQAERVNDLTLHHRGGRLVADVRGEGALDAPHVISARLVVRGESSASVGVMGGTLAAEVGGQSSLIFGGTGSTVHLSVSGQSSVNGNGDFTSVTGPVSGQSSVNISGNIRSDSLNASGQSTVLVNGHRSGYAPAAPRHGGGWNF